MDLSLVPYQHTSKSETPLHQDGDTHNNSFNLVTVKYRECMKNHAASIGGHANDGCGEFMPPADHGLTCAACGCHRNFHRREGSAGVAHLLLPPPQQHPLFFYNAGGSSTSVLMKHLTHDCVDNDDDYHDRRSETPDRGEVNFGLGGRAAAKNKRFRTKFTQEQKDKMLEFAEKIGWRINKHDDMALNQFCNEVGVKRNVLKVWMHNNKNAHRRRESTSPSSAVAGAPTPPPAPPQPVEV